MVAVTRRGVRTTPRRSSSVATTSRGSKSLRGLGPGAATIALPRSVRLEDIPQEQRTKVYLPTREQFLALLHQGWTPVSFRYAAASHEVYSESNPDDPSDVFSISDVVFLSRDVVLQKPMYVGRRQTMREIVVRLPQATDLPEGWHWISESMS